MTHEDDVLARLARAIDAGGSVDWPSTESSAADEPAREVIRELAVIAAVSQVHRSATAALSNPREPLRTWGTFRLLEKVGEGAYGEVYRAWDARLDREVALKLMPKGLVDPSASSSVAVSTIEEGRLLARVRHPSVVTIYGAERIDDRVGLWMEYIEGRTLHQLVTEDGRRFSPSEVEGIGRAICGGMAAVHAAGLLHLDIKAQNVMMARDGRVVLMDFGSGRERCSESAPQVAGTPLYIAPEMITGTSGPSIRSDIYSVGVLLFFLLTGSYPVVGGDVLSLRQAHERGERRSLRAIAPGLPRRLLRSVDRALDSRPENRYESAHALAADLAIAPGTGAPSRRKEMGRNLDAHALCLRGHALIERRGMANAQLAVELFRRAIVKDRAFATAHAGLACAYVFWSFPYRGLPFAAAYPFIRPAAEKALELDPLLPAAHVAVAWAHTYDRDWSHAEKSFKEAIRLNPRLTTTYTSYSLAILQPQRRFDEGLQLLRAALQHDPVSLNVQREIGELQLLSGRYAEAVETLGRVAEVEPDFAFVQTYLARAQMHSGSVREALPRLEQGFPWLAQAYVMLGRRADAERLAVEWQAYPFRLAIIAGALGEADRAAGALEQAALSEPHRMGWLLVQPELATVRDHPRVVAIRRGFNLP